jgi:DHA1 family bicyclomycin/chloramphenicol resistance-like MFS transporter
MTRSLSLITALLAILTAVGPISTDMYLPAFPAMKLALHARPGQAQMTLAAWFIGLSIGQIAHGPLSDFYGRRRPLLVGTALYTAASIGCALSATMIDLSWWRVWAAFGGAASLVIPRVIIADVVENGAEAASMLGRMVMVMGVVPMLAPTFGGLVAEYWTWRWIFWIAAIYGGLCCVLTYVLLPETHRTHRHRRFRIADIAIQYILVWRNRRFRPHALQGGLATFSLFAFLGGAPAVFQNHFSLSPAVFGEVFILNAIGYIVGTQANARLIARYGTDRVLTGGTLLLIATSGAMLAMACTAAGGALGMASGMMASMMALGMVLPGAALGSVLGQHRSGGAASALYGTTVFLIGAVSTILVGWAGTDSPVPMTGLMLAGALGALVCDRLRPR